MVACKYATEQPDAFVHVVRAEATNARVAWFSVGSLLICVVLAAWQLYYLKQFFTKKKAFVSRQRCPRFSHRFSESPSQDM